MTDTGAEAVKLKVKSPPVYIVRVRIKQTFIRWDHKHPRSDITLTSRFDYMHEVCFLFTCCLCNDMKTCLRQNDP